MKTPGTIRGVLKRKKITQLHDPEGNPIPLDYIKDHLLIKDNFVREIGTLWISIHQQIAHLKKLLLEGGPAMYDYLSENDDVRNDSKGGFTEYNFGKDMKVVVSYSLVYHFDDSLMKRSAAYMDEFFKRANDPEVVKFVRQAFKKKNDKYDIVILSRVKRMKIDDPNFKKAIEFMNEAISSTPTKLRTEFEVRDAQGEYKALPLNISYVDPNGISGLGDDLLQERLTPGS